MTACGDCHGSGSVWNGEQWNTCGACNGKQLGVTFDDVLIAADAPPTPTSTAHVGTCAAHIAAAGASRAGTGAVAWHSSFAPSILAWRTGVGWNARRKRCPLCSSC